LADTVVVVGVTRANEELRPRDIKQMFGRAGRQHGKPEADAYLVLPENARVPWSNALTSASSFEVRSRLGDEISFMFHFVSQVVSGAVTDQTSFDAWYGRTLDFCQRKTRNEKLTTYEEAAISLHQTSCADYNQQTKKIKPKPLGRVCARYYFSPLDVRDWFVNLSRLHNKSLLKNDTCQEWMIATITSAVNWESEDIKRCASPYQETVSDAGLYCRAGTSTRFLSVHHAMTGTRPNCELPELGAVRADLPRSLSAIGAICRCARNMWGDMTWLTEALELRFKYNVNMCLTNLVKMKGIGKSAARELYDKFEIENEVGLRNKLDDIKKRASPSTKRGVTRFLNGEEDIMIILDEKTAGTRPADESSPVLNIFSPINL